ncbi:MAG: PadR family transcriptional regulator [Actinobacteria bacterium]|nr:PadR family transcriptional regulator [Actinomycetota bacterium]
MSVGMSLLAILDEAPTYGLRLKNEFEARTGGVWPLNVGQVYTTLGRLQRDGLLNVRNEEDAEGQKFYEITNKGRGLLGDWFEEPSGGGTPSREELVLKLVMVASRASVEGVRVIQAERRQAVELLQGYTRIKRDVPTDADLGWLFLLDSLIFQAEARVRWLDACEARLQATHTRPPADTAMSAAEVPDTKNAWMSL